MTVALIISARPSYSRVRSLVPALVAHGLTVKVIVVGSALLERYGAVVGLIERECGPVEKCWTVVEGETLETTARSTALAMLDVATVLRRLQPDAVIVHADRHEVLGAAAAARCLELPLVHLQGGEQTGSVDDRVRDAITQMADLHLVSTDGAKARIRAMRGHEAVVTGCPSIDVAVEALRATQPLTMEDVGGTGASFELSGRFLVVLQHPTSDHSTLAYLEMSHTLQACEAIGLPVIVFWPGNEAGMSLSAKAIRVYRDRLPMRTVRNLPPVRFLRLLRQAQCLVGNSSVGIRECAFLGVPVVNIGDRQRNRERGPNVVDAPWNTFQVMRAIDAQMHHGTFPPSDLYGDGHGGARMADAIVAWAGGL